IWPTAGAAVVLAAAWFLWPSKRADNSANQAGSAKSTRRPPNFLEDGDVLHYIAGEKMDAWADPAKPPPAPKPNDLVMAWHDLSPTGGDGAMTSWDKLKIACPKFLVEKPTALNSSVGTAHF